MITPRKFIYTAILAIVILGELSFDALYFDVDAAVL